MVIAPRGLLLPVGNHLTKVVVLGVVLVVSIQTLIVGIVEVLLVLLLLVLLLLVLLLVLLWVLLWVLLIVVLTSWWVVVSRGEVIHPLVAIRARAVTLGLRVGLVACSIAFIPARLLLCLGGG